MINYNNEYEEPEDLYEDSDEIEEGVIEMTEKEKANYRDEKFAHPEVLREEKPKLTPIDKPIEKKVIEQPTIVDPIKSKNVLSKNNTLIYEWDDADITKLLDLKPEKVIFYLRITKEQYNQLKFLTIMYRTKIIAGPSGKVV